MEDNDTNKVAPKDGSLKVHIAFVVLTVLVVSLLLAVIIITIAFSVEIADLKSGNDAANQQQQNLANSLDNLNSTVARLSQQGVPPSCFLWVGCDEKQLLATYVDS